MLRALLGLIKGGLVGAGIGLAASKMGLVGGASGYLVCGAVGFLVGIVCGKAIWRQETLVTPVLKGLFGVGLGLGLYWVATKTLGGVTVPLPVALGLTDRPFTEVPLLFASLVGILYGILVEVDDGERKAAARAPQAP